MVSDELGVVRDELGAVRRWDYTGEGLPDADFPDSPWLLADQWVRQADAASASNPAVHEPRAMALASVDHHGRPDVRTVLMRFFTPAGPGFVSYDGSAKAGDIDATGWLAATLTWTSLHRAIRCRGRAVELDGGMLAEYYRSRPWGSRISAWASHQSQEVGGRADLEQRYAEVAQRYPDTGSPADVPVPPSWRGWRIECEEVEFWGGRRNRLHDRWLARRTSADADLATPGAWHWSRLQP